MINTRSLKDKDLEILLTQTYPNTSYSVRRFIVEEYLLGEEVESTIRGILIDLLTAFDDEGHSGFSAAFGTNSTCRILSGGYRHMKDMLVWDWHAFSNLERFKDPALERSDAAVIGILAKDNTVLTLDQMKTLIRYFVLITRQLPLSPLTGNDDEWSGRQNTRNSAIFKNNNDVAYHLDGISIYRLNGNNGWSSPLSSMKIAFPYNGETYRIVVKEEGEQLIEDPTPVGECTQEHIGRTIFNHRNEFFEIIKVLDNGDIHCRDIYLADIVIEKDELFETIDFSYINMRRDEEHQRSFKVAKWTMIPKSPD